MKGLKKPGIAVDGTRGALPPATPRIYRDSAIPCEGLKRERTKRARSRDGLAPESALGLRPRMTLSSAPVSFIVSLTALGQ
jgi:hypothetical protein